MKTKKMVLTALMAALCCVATMIIKIPTPATGGYIHPGDAMVILSGIILGPVYGLLAAGIGSAMADLIGGYFIYVPVTFVIKGIIGFVSGFAYGKLKRKSKSVGILMGGIADVIFVAGGYFLFEAVLYGVGGAALSVPANLIQGLAGLIISFVLAGALTKLSNI